LLDTLSLSVKARFRMEPRHGFTGSHKRVLVHNFEHAKTAVRSTSSVSPRPVSIGSSQFEDSGVTSLDRMFAVRHRRYLYSRFDRRCNRYQCPVPHHTVSESLVPLFEKFFRLWYDEGWWRNMLDVAVFRSDVTHSRSSGRLIFSSGHLTS